MIKTDTLIRISGVPLASAVCRLKQLHCIVWRGGVPLEATPFSGVPLASAVCRFCVCMALHGQDYDLARTVAVTGQVCLRSPPELDIWHSFKHVGATIPKGTVWASKDTGCAPKKSTCCGFNGTFSGSFGFNGTGSGSNGPGGSAGSGSKGALGAFQLANGSDVNGGVSADNPVILLGRACAPRPSYAGMQVGAMRPYHGIPLAHGALDSGTENRSDGGRKAQRRSRCR